MPVHDPDLPAADVLLGEGAAEALTPAVAPEGGTVRHATLAMVDYTPARRVRASYDAIVDWRDGTSSEELLGVNVRSSGEVRGEIAAEIGGVPADVWCYPDDPYLPGLDHANDADFMAEVLEAAGIGGDGEFAFEALGYSPSSRSVFEITHAPVSGKLVFKPGEGFVEPEPVPVLYVKIMRPSNARALLDAHAAVGDRIPVARCLHADPDLGVLALAPLPGVPLWDCITEGVHRPLGPGELLEVLQRLEDVELPSSSRRLSPTRAARNNIATLAAVLPDVRPALERFRERLGDDTPQPELTIHGDFHEVQLLVDDRGLSGVLDLDDAGRGQRVDDLAMMLGRLWSYAQTDVAGERVAAYFESLLAVWEQHVDPLELRRRTAAVALNHALQPFRYQEPEWRARCSEGIAIAAALLTKLVPPQ